MKYIIIFLIAIMVLSVQHILPQSNNFELFYTGFSGSITAIAEDTSSNIWAALSESDQDDINEVILINNQIIDTVFVYSKFPILDLEVDLNNVLWIATQDNGLAKYNGTELTYIDVSEIFTVRDNNNVNCIEFDSENNMWIGTQDGIAKYDGNNWTVYDYTNSPLQYVPDIYTMSIDNSNNLWFGHYYGMGRLSDTTWSFWGEESPFNYITTIKHHKNGSVWVTPEWGRLINLTSDTSWIEYPFLVFPKSWNFQFTIDTNGVIWFQEFASPGKIVVYNGSTFIELNVPFSGFKSIYSDRNNNKWFGINGYIVKYSGDFPTSIKDNDFSIPKDFLLSQNFPNPFNPSTTIIYSIKDAGFVNIKVFDVIGQEVAELVNEEKQAGVYQIDFNADNLPSGIYIYRIQSGNYSAVKKMILLK